MVVMLWVKSPAMDGRLVFRGRIGVKYIPENKNPGSQAGQPWIKTKKTRLKSRVYRRYT
ncbi:MAG: hypothetical protein KGJ97_02270 [Xanthomonadaceae bacterium]|nr:hypothetical protein [Xanthomonadaceae bacterium]MDE3073388.1 hypothetical protein [Pseudomonadota bacterium]